MSAHSTGSKKRKTSAEPSSPPETKKARSSDVDGDVEVESAGEAVVLGMPIDPPTQPVASSSSGTSLAAPISPGQENTNGTGNGNGLTEGANKEEIMAKDGFTVVKRDKGKDKKQKKLEKARLAEKPQFMYNTDGFKAGKKIGIAHVRDLALHIVTEYTAPNWMMVKHKSSITHTVVLMIPGLLPCDIGLLTPDRNQNLPFEITPRPRPPNNPPTCLPVMHKLFSHGCPTRAPGDNRRMFSAVKGLLEGPMTDKEKTKKENERKIAAKEFEKQKGKRKQTGGDDYWMEVMSYLVTPNDMFANNYPIPRWMDLEFGDVAYIPGRGQGIPKKMMDEDEPNGSTSDDQEEEAKIQEEGDGWAETPRVKSKGKGKEKLEGEEFGQMKIVAVDCEMCETKAGSELTRITLLDFETGKVLLDEFVKPLNPITDYLTQFSGITAEKLATSTHNLSQIHSRLFSERIITPTTILLGHSLDSDLTAMKLRHSLCIDTALIYANVRGGTYKPKLKHLTSKWLARDIQTGGLKGHDSEEDAKACVDLLKMKLAKGPDFGEVAVDNESIFDKIARHRNAPGQVGRKGAIVDYGRPSALHPNANTIVTCTSDDEITQAVIDNAQTHDFVFARWMGLDQARKWSGYVPGSAGSTSETSTTVRAQAIADTLPAAESKTLEETLAQVNARIQRLNESLPPNTALIILSGHGDPRRSLELNNRKMSFERLYRSGGPDAVSHLKDKERWESQDERDLVQAVEEARAGMAFFCVK